MWITRPSIRLLLGTYMIAAAGPMTVVKAQIWDGGGTDDFWGTANNWNPNGVPANDGTANIIFRGSIRLTPVVLPGQDVLSITFNSPAGAFVVNSSDFRTFLDIGSGGITNNDNSLQTITSPIRLNAAQTWRAASGKLAIDQAAGSGFVLTIDGGFNTTVGRLTGFSTALVKNGAGVLTLTGTSNYNGGTTVNAGILDVSNASGSATGTGTVAVASGATLRGTGIIGGPVQNEGAVHPGASAGTLAIQNTYTQDMSGSLGIEIGGLAPGTEYDQLSIVGTAALSGTLMVTLINGYSPIPGDSFELLTAGAISGEFATLDLPPLTDTARWRVEYMPTAVSLTLITSSVLTYQGRLQDAGAPADGLYDFNFRLFDAPLGGSQIEATQCVDNLPVTKGLFTTMLDFGRQYATPAQRFLEVQVRADTGLNCFTTSGFITLPRQLLTSTPLATHAKSAFSLDAPDGSPPSAVFVDNAGKVGVGTTSPQATVHLVTPDEGLRVQGPSVGGANTAWIGFRDFVGMETGNVGDGSVGDSSIYLTSDADDVHLYASLAHTLTAKAGGNVGIGTTAPTAKLDVRGDVRLGASGQFRAAAGEENLRIIRGVIRNGDIVTGSGFAAVRTGEGQYQVTFTTPFSATPAVTATGQGLGNDFFNEIFIMTQSVTESGANFQMLLRSDGSFVENRPFHFIAIGPR